MNKGGGLFLPKHIVRAREKEAQEQKIRSLSDKNCKDCWGKGIVKMNGDDQPCRCTQRIAAKHIARISKNIVTPKKKIFTPYDK